VRGAEGGRSGIEFPAARFPFFIFNMKKLYHITVEYDTIICADSPEDAMRQASSLPESKDVDDGGTTEGADAEEDDHELLICRPCHTFIHNNEEQTKKNN
jgi:hypothetical protein